MIFQKRDGSEKYDISDINNDTIAAFSSLLSYVDSLVGKVNYYIDSIYSLSDFSKYIDDCVVKIVLEKYLDNYNFWRGTDSQNPYKIMFSLNLNNKKFEDFYYSFLLGKKYEEDLVKQLSTKNDYQYKV